MRFDGARLEETHGPAATFWIFDGVGAENAERIGIARNEKSIELRAEMFGSRRLF